MKKRSKKAKVTPTDIFEDPKYPLFRHANTFLAVLTIVSIAAVALETVVALERYAPVFFLIEMFAVTFFSAEYLIRLLTAKKPWRYVFSFFGLIDLIAILPSILGLSNLTFLKSVRALRIIRLLRMVRLTKFARIRNKDKAAHSVYKINLEIYAATLTVAVLFLGALFYIFEPHPDAKDIPSGMYWALKAILGGISYTQPETTGGTITLVLARFTSMILLGMMMSLIGTMLRKLLIGAEKDS